MRTLPNRGWVFALAIGALGIGLVYAVLINSGWVMNGRERDFNEKLKQAVRDGKPTVKLEDLTDFAWERVCYVGVYASPKHHFKDPERKRLFEQGSLNLPWIGSEGAWGLIFTDASQRTIAIRIPRDPDVASPHVLKDLGRSDLLLISPKYCQSRNEAVLRLFTHGSRTYAVFLR